MNQVKQKLMHSFKLVWFVFGLASYCAEQDPVHKPIPTLHALAYNKIIKELTSSACMDRFENKPEEVECKLCACNKPAQRLIVAELLKAYKPRICAKNIAQGPLYKGDSWTDVMQFSADGSYLAVATHKITIWDTCAHQVAFQTKAIDGYPEFRATALAFNPSGDHLAVGTNLGDACIYDLSACRLQHKLHDPGELYGDEFQMNALAYNADGTLLASGSRYGELSIWNTETGDRVRTMYHGPEECPHAIFAVRFLPDAITVEARTGIAFWYWDINTGEYLRDCYHRYYGQEEDAKRGYRAWRCGGGVIELHDVNDKKIHELAYEGQQRLVKFSVDGARIATATEGGVQIWDAPEYEAILENIDIMQALYLYKQLKEQERSLFAVAWHMISSRISAKEPSPAAETYFKQMQEQLPDNFKRILK